MQKLGVLSLVLSLVLPYSNAHGESLRKELRCFSGLHRVSSMPFTPAHLKHPITPDIRYNYGEISQNFFVLPDPEQKNTWHFFGKQFAARKTLSDEMKMYQIEGAPGRFFLLHNWKKSSGKDYEKYYPESNGKLFEEFMLYEERNPSGQKAIRDYGKALETIQLPAKGIDSKSRDILRAEVDRLAAYVEEHLLTGDADDFRSYTREQFVTAHIQALKTCANAYPDSTAIKAELAKIGNGSRHKRGDIEQKNAPSEDEGPEGEAASAN